MMVAEMPVWAVVMGGLADVVVQQAHVAAREAKQRCAEARWADVLAGLPSVSHEVEGDCKRRGQRQSLWELTRELGPAVLACYKSEKLPRRIVLTRREDVLWVMRNPKVFGMVRREMFTNFGIESVPLSFDGEQHRRYRKTLDKLFSPRAVSKIEPALRKQAAALVGAVAERGECEAVGEIGGVFACQGLLTMLGLPLADTGWLLETMAFRDETMPLQDSKKLLAYLVNWLAEAKWPQGHRFLGRLLGAEPPFDRNEVVSVYGSVLVTGVPNLKGIIGFALLELARNPQLRAQLCGDPALIPVFVDEVIRVESSAPYIARKTKQDVTLGGIWVPEGTWVGVCLGSINVEGAPKIEVAAGPRRRHWALGTGPHRCLGAHLARVQMAILIEAWLKRIPEFELAPGFSPKVVDRGAETLAALPLIWPVMDNPCGP